MKWKKDLINYGVLERVIIDIENVFVLHNCDIEEKQLVLKHVNQRLLKDVHKQRTSDLVNGFGGGILGNILNRHKKKTENEDQEKDY